MRTGHLIVFLASMLLLAACEQNSTTLRFVTPASPLDRAIAEDLTALLDRESSIRLEATGTPLSGGAALDALMAGDADIALVLYADGERMEWGILRRELNRWNLIAKYATPGDNEQDPKTLERLQDLAPAGPQRLLSGILALAQRKVGLDSDRIQVVPELDLFEVIPVRGVGQSRVRHRSHALDEVAPAFGVVEHLT